MKHYTKEELDMFQNDQMSVLGKIICAGHLKSCEKCAALLKELEEENQLIKELRESIRLFDDISKEK